MGRARDDDLAEAARRRLESLRRELGMDQPVGAGHVTDHGTGHVTGPGPRPATPEEVPPPRAVPAGRHVRERRASSLLAGWIDDRLPDVLRGRVRIGSRELALVVVFAAVALVAAAVVVLRSGVDSDPVPVAAVHDAGAPLAMPSQAASATATTAASVAGSAAGSAPVAGASASPGAAQVMVDVAGRVRRPGVVQLPAGSRVIDALRKAGGARPKVDLSTLNLARVLTDGEQILVGRPDPATGGVAGAAAAASPAQAAGAMVNLNSATEEQLETLPGVGPVTAQEILQWRQDHGRFSSLDELLEVSGIGDKTLARLAPYLTL